MAQELESRLQAELRLLQDELLTCKRFEIDDRDEWNVRCYRVGPGPRGALAPEYVPTVVLYRALRALDYSKKLLAQARAEHTEAIGLLRRLNAALIHTDISSDSREQLDQIRDAIVETRQFIREPPDGATHEIH